MDPRIWIHTKMSWIRNTASDTNERLKYTIEAKSFSVVFLFRSFNYSMVETWTRVPDPWHFGTVFFPNFFCLLVITFWKNGTFTTVCNNRKSYRSRKTEESRNSYYFCLMMGGSGYGSVPLTNGFGYGRPKNLNTCIRILYFVRSACKLRARRTEYKSVFFFQTT